MSDELSKVRNKNYKVLKDQREDTIDCIDYMLWVSKDARKPP